jgi:hypothetical protein
VRESPANLPVLVSQGCCDLKRLQRIFTENTPKNGLAVLPNKTKYKMEV